MRWNNIDNITKWIDAIILDIGVEAFVLRVVFYILTGIALLIENKILFILYLIAGIIILYMSYTRNQERNKPQNTYIVSRETIQHEEAGIIKSPVATLIYDEDDLVRWVNPSMQFIFGKDNILGDDIASLDEDFQKMFEVSEDDEKHGEWSIKKYKDNIYRVHHDVKQKTLYMIDITYEAKLVENRKLDKVVFGYIYIDDYDELKQTLPEEELLNYESFLLRNINELADKYQVYLKRIEDDCFIIIMNRKNLKDLEKTKFKDLGDIKKESHDLNTPLYLSVGIAFSDEEEYSIAELEEQATNNLELALGRGGDQVVIRAKGGRARFYGGNTNPVQKRGNVRSRLVYQALKTSVLKADKIYIAGHKNPDMDAIGSALGMYYIAGQLDKKAKIIIDSSNLNHGVRDLLNEKEIAKAYDDIFIEVSDVDIDEASDNDLLILVDHHRPSISEAQMYIDKMDVIIIDHHRRSEEFPSTSILTYIEPSASSASEMVAEFYGYPGNDLKAPSETIATALLAGIIVDTNNFTVRTGSRTFDVASYLRSLGADISLIQRFLKEDLDFIQERNKIISTSEFIYDRYVIATGPLDQDIEVVMAAQAADYLLKVKDVEASFVIYNINKEEVGISARSLGNINVQLLMEKLGGGGHLTTAATQIKSSSITEVKEKLIKLITEKENEE